MTTRSTKAKGRDAGSDGNPGDVSKQGGIPVRETSNSELKMEDGTIFKPGDIQGMFDFIQGIRYSGDDIKNMARFVGVEGLKDGGSDTELVMLLFQHLSGRVRPLGKDTKSGAAEETSILLGSIDESIGGLGGELSRSVPEHPVSSMKEVGDETGPSAGRCWNNGTRKCIRSWDI